MKKIVSNLKGLYLFLKKDNSKFCISKNRLHNKILNFPSWMNEQIEEDFKYFENQNNSIDETIKNFKKAELLKDIQLLRIKIKNNKIKYQNFLSIRFHPRFIRLKNFFNSLLKNLKFPDIDFLYSIHDSFDNEKWLNCLKAPIFCISKLKGNNKVILFPHIEWVQKNAKLLNLTCKVALHLNFDKKIPKVFWRGSITGTEDLNKNKRAEIVKLSRKYPNFFDAFFSNINNLSKKNKKALKDYLQKGSFPPAEQLKYKYLLAIDGHAFAGSFFWQLFSNSVILKNKSNYLEWYYRKLLHNEHYLEFENEKDLLEKITFLNKNNKLCEKLYKNANNFAKTYLTNENIVVYIFKLFEKYSLIKNL